MFGLVLSDPNQDGELRNALIHRLDELMIDDYCFTEEDTPFFEHTLAGEPFIRRVCEALLRPDTPVPAERLYAALQTDLPRPANAIRKVLQLQLSLLPKLRMDPTVMTVMGGHMLGQDLLIPHVDDHGAADCILPKGIWTELQDGRTHELHFQGVYGLTEQPVLVRENTLLPVAVNSRMVMYDETDRVTLHWYQPQGSVTLRLAAGTEYAVAADGDSYQAQSDTTKPWRLIVHRDGEELLVR